MMYNRLVHTPEGVRDIYGQEYARKLSVQKLIHRQLALYGYEDIQTPAFEYFDVFSREIGTTPSKELYKFFDKEGNTLVLRPDFTPSMARCAAKYFMDEAVPIRFCYQGNTFTNTGNLQGKLKEVTQMGAELMGDGSVEADGEMIALAIESLLAAGLCRQAGLDDETELALRDFISGKNIFGAENLLQEKGIDPESCELLLGITDYFGSVDFLERAKASVHNLRSLKALSRLEKLYQVLCGYGVEKYVSFDLGMLSKYNYYTGVIFKAYTYGVGDAVAKGGRYDNLLGCFGKQAPAIGFAVVIDDLMNALTRQKHLFAPCEESRILTYQKEDYVQKLGEARELRRRGIPTILTPLPDAEERTGKEVEG